MAKDPEQLAHQEWLGYVQPVGLVVSIPALLAAQAHVNRNIATEHQEFLGCLSRGKRDELVPEIRDFPTFTQKVFGWEPADLVDMSGDDEAAKSLEVTLPEYSETLRPTWAVKEFKPNEGQKPWMMLVQAYPIGTDLDKSHAPDERHWQASPEARIERLLRETEVPAGLLFNGTHLRLVYAPRGETSGHMTFPVSAMAEVAGRPMFAALHMLLEAPRLFSLPPKQRLPAILADSRKYQNVVSTQLAEQVLAALYELVRGFQAADDHRKGQFLADVLREDPDHVYAGLLTVLMRLVFLLFAEDRDLLSSDPVYANFYAVTGLFDRLRADAGRYTDTMDQRYGAWAQLLTLFRMIYDGGRHGGLRIPARKGYLFDPDRYNFLEGRAWKTPRRLDDKPEIPKVSDGVVYRVLQNLLILDGERLSYRSLDVEQIGSVYETMMGFNLRVAEGRSIAIKPVKAHGAPATINLEALLAAKPAERAKWLQDQTDQKPGQAADTLKKAATLDELLAALGKAKKVAWHATPSVVPKAAMILQPSDERRRSGSHYTPRSLTEPIVRTTLRPVLERFGPKPTPDQILDLNVCDPAMGSGAFLVEACRQLGDELVKAWHVHNQVPKLPPDEDEILYARRVITQRCLYGVDRNPMAVDLAKLSLWLATLAKDHPFTFLDHSLRPGDSLVGLSKKQIVAFHWEPKKQRDFFRNQVEERLKRVTEFRREILAVRDDVPYEHLRQQLDVADEQLSLARLAGDLVIAAYFSADKDKKREQKLDELAAKLGEYLGPPMKIEHRAPLVAAVERLRSGDRPVTPFHWEIEFPEVFSGGSPGFDVIVGNPPFMGGKRISGALGKTYSEWLALTHEGASGNADLVAHFFRRAFALVRERGTSGLIATNTIAQGDTRRGGLRYIGKTGGEIFDVRRRIRWPGAAAVVVSVVAVHRGAYSGQRKIEGRDVDFISAFLFDRGTHDDPASIRANSGSSYIGCDIKGQGFLFDDSDPDASPLACMESLISEDSSNAERILPYIGGEEINTSPTHQHHRWVIYFDEMDEMEARRWPALMDIVERKVLPERLTKSKELAEWPWWQFWRVRRELQEACAGLSEVLVVAQTGNALAFAFKRLPTIFSHTMVVFPSCSRSFFCVIQSRIHQCWALAFAATMKDDARYIPHDCFDTFPFPVEFQRNKSLEQIGLAYYDFRAAFMVRNNEGLTKTYNRFHDRDHDVTEPDREIVAGIQRLRELHAAMDRAVLDAYGWKDLADTATCEFLLDYEEEDEEEKGESSGGRGRKKPWRYRWPDEFRDEVLARLLELNKKRAEEEAVTGLAAQGTGKPAGKRPVRRKNSSPQDGEEGRTLFR